MAALCSTECVGENWLKKALTSALANSSACGYLTVQIPLSMLAGGTEVPCSSFEKHAADYPAPRD